MTKNNSAFQVVRIAIASYRRQARKESWKADHDAAMKCYRFEEMLWAANGVFDAITQFDENHRARVFSGEIEYDADHSGVIKEAYRWWLGPSEGFKQAIERYRGRFGEVSNSEEFLSRCREAQGILTDDAEFFSGDALTQLRDEAIDAFRAGQTSECGPGQ